MPLSPETQVHFVDNVAKAAELIEWIKQPREVLAFDLETTGLDPRDEGAAIRLAQLGDYTQGWAIPWERWGGVFMEALNLWQGPLTGHNTSFDNRWLEIHAGWKPPHDRLHDTMLMAQVSEPDKPAGLKPLGDRLIDHRASLGQQLLSNAMKEQDWDWGDIPVDFDVYWQYGCIDTILTALLWKHYRADLRYPQAYDLELNARRVVSAMEDNGIKIDLEYCDLKSKELKEYVTSSKQWAVDNWGVNISSTPQVVDLFQNRLGQIITRTTDSGAPSVDKVQMATFKASSDPTVSGAASFILDVKNADKKVNSYFKNFSTYHHDGVLHTQFKTMGARTGRMSSTKPALQTIGKGDTVLRDAFIPFEGHHLLSVDYSQIELRLMCHFSGDPALIQAFKIADETNGDFFVELGKAIYKDPTFTKEDKRRNLIKTFVYALLYGAGMSKMALSAGVPEDEMKAFVHSFNTTYPGIPAFQQQIVRLGEQRERDEGQGYIITPFGKRIPCDQGQARTLLNYLLQGHAAEILKDALVKMDAAGLTKYLLLAIHDEVIASIPHEEFQDVSDQIVEIMSVKSKYAVDIIAQAEGPFARWGEK